MYVILENMYCIQTFMVVFYYLKIIKENKEQNVYNGYYYGNNFNVYGCLGRQSVLYICNGFFIIIKNKGILIC